MHPTTRTDLVGAYSSETPASPGNPTWFFHVTTRSALNSIRQHGLDNTRSMEAVWSNGDDWDDGVYLWDNPVDAALYAESLRDLGWDPVILKVNGGGLSVQPDLTGTQRVAGAWYTPTVSPERISEA